MTPTRRRWLVGGSVAAGLVILAGVALWYVFLRDDAPPPVSLEDAVEAAGPDETTDTTTAASQPEGVEGAWAVQIGDGTAESTFAGYRVTEELASVGTKEAVGRTGDITGSLVIEGTTVTEVEVEVDMSTLDSGTSGRDAQLKRQALETDTFPTASFTLSDPIDLGTVPSEGEPIEVLARGELTVHGVTKTVDLPLEGQLVGDRIAVVGSLEIAFADHGIETPRAAAVLSVEDRGTLEFQLFYTRA